jgi:hypothetical protein
LATFELFFDATEYGSTGSAKTGVEIDRAQHLPNERPGRGDLDLNESLSKSIRYRLPSPVTLSEKS